MLLSLKFTETAPSAPGTAASSAAVSGSSGAAGVAMASPHGLEQFNTMSVYATLQGGTGGTLDVYIQTSPDGGTTWIDYAHFPQLTAGAAAISYRFSVSRATGSATPVVVGSNTTPALAANTIVGGDWDDRLRLLFVAGASTTLGKAQSVTLVFSKD